jgi:hypothetical protein
MGRNLKFFRTILLKNFCSNLLMNKCESHLTKVKVYALTLTKVTLPNFGSQLAFWTFFGAVAAIWRNSHRWRSRCVTCSEGEDSHSEEEEDMLREEEDEMYV